SRPHPLFATPTTGTSSAPRSTSPTSAGKVSSLARSPVAPKMTRASTGSVAMKAPPALCLSPPSPPAPCRGRLPRYSGGAGGLRRHPGKGSVRRFSCGHSDRVSEHYDVIIIGTGAGGGTLAHTLAPSGQKILL